MKSVDSHYRNLYNVLSRSVEATVGMPLPECFLGQACRANMRHSREKKWRGLCHFSNCAYPHALRTSARTWLWKHNNALCINDDFQTMCIGCQEVENFHDIRCLYQTLVCLWVLKTASHNYGWNISWRLLSFSFTISLWLVFSFYYGQDLRLLCYMWPVLFKKDLPFQAICISKVSAAYLVNYRKDRSKKGQYCIYISKYSTAKHACIAGAISFAKNQSTKNNWRHEKLFMTTILLCPFQTNRLPNHWPVLTYSKQILVILNHFEDPDPTARSLRN